MNGVPKVFANELSRITRGITCSSTHPESGARCVLRATQPHRKHKSESSQRWESEREQPE